jgi:hypothetical protein
MVGETFGSIMLQRGTAHHGVGRDGARNKILSVCVVALRFVHMQQGGSLPGRRSASSGVVGSG